MSRLEEIDIELEKLRDRLPRVKGRECEVRTRVIGYYASVSLFNPGQRSAYGERKTFDLKSQSVASK